LNLKSKKEMSDYLNKLLCTEGIDFTPMKANDLKKLIIILSNLESLIKKRFRSGVKAEVKKMLNESEIVNKVIGWLTED